MAHTHEHNGNGKCVECAVPQLARNHYFTGKLLVERDFREEQEFLLGKDRRHNQALHGWGVVCGLRVKQHPREDCRRQYLIIEPGTAVDCCGHEILVTHEEYFDFREHLPAEWLVPPAEGEEPQKHKLQVCLRYGECPTEDVPSLFDECGCDEDACQPNRILESYVLDVRVDEPEHEHQVVGPKLDRTATLSIDDAFRVAVNEPKRRLSVLTSTTAGTASSFAVTSYSIDDHHQEQPTIADPGTAKDLAVSLGGDETYVAVGTAGLDLEIRVYGEGDATPANTLTLAGQAERSVVLAPAPGGRLYALVGEAADAELHAWDHPAADAAPSDSSGALGVAARTLAVTPDGTYVVVAVEGSPELRLIAAADLTDVTSGDVDANATALAIADTTAAPRLYAARTDSSVRVFDVKPTDATPFPPLTDALPLGGNRPVDLAVSEGGRFLHVLERDAAGTTGAVRVVDTHLLATTPGPDAVRFTLPLDAGVDLAMSGSRRLYVAYDEGDAGFSGVAVIDLTESDCAELFIRTIDGCPECADAECVVLATIDDYAPGQPVEDADIDNLRERRLLPSTTVITDVVRCLLEHGTGAGERGPQGPPGLGISDVTADFVDTLAEAGVDFDTATRIVDLHIPKGPKGDSGDAGAGINDVTGDFVDTLAEAGVEFDATTRVVDLHIPKGPKGDPGDDGLGINDVTGDFVDTLAEAGVDFDATTRVVDLHIPKGPKGDPGDDGLGINDVTGTVVDTVAQAGVDFDATTRIVNIRVPKGEPGDPGEPGGFIKLDLPTIVALSFPHAGAISRTTMTDMDGKPITNAAGPVAPTLFTAGLVIGFDRPVMAETLDENSVQVLIGHPVDFDVEQPVRCYCPLVGTVSGIPRLNAKCESNPLTSIPKVSQDKKTGPVRGVRFVPAAGWPQPPQDIVVLVYGDHVLGSDKITLPDEREVNPALDGNHLGPGIPKRCPTGDGVEGGTFRSWFRLV